MNKFFTFLLFLISLFYFGCLGESNKQPSNKPKDLLTENSIMDSQSANVDSLISEYINNDGSGLALLVTKNNKILYQKGYGLANLEQKTPIDTKTIFYLASVSKQFTAMAIMILAEEGKLNYDDPITKFFPKFPDYAKTITIKHLLYHTGGLSDYMKDDDESDDFSASGKETNSKEVTRKALNFIVKEPKPLFEAGESYEYSNSGYVVLAGIVEEASKKSFPDFLKEKIFQPLSMNNTSIIETKDKLPTNLARGYNGKGKKAEDSNLGDTELDLIYGDGGVLSTVEDLYKWDQALYSEKLVKQDTLSLAFTSGKTNDGEKVDYGFGWSLGKFLGKKLIEHDGSWYGWSSVISRLPEEKFTVILLSNNENFDSIKVAHKIAKLYIKE
jgi:CubicO group peptidase (beta-lactamase class C family)